MKKFNGDLYLNKENYNEYLDLAEIDGNLLIANYLYADLPNLKIIRGNLYLHDNSKLQAWGLERITMGLELLNNSDAFLPSIITIDNFIKIGNKAKLRLPNTSELILKIFYINGGEFEGDILTKIKSKIMVRDNGKFLTPKLLKIIGNLTIEKNTRILSFLKFITGDLNISDSSVINAPILRRIGKNVFIGEGITVNLDQLLNIGGALNLYYKSIFDTPKLVTIKKDLRVWNEAEFDAEKLVNVLGNISIIDGAKVNTPKLKMSVDENI